MGGEKQGENQKTTQRILPETQGQNQGTKSDISIKKEGEGSRNETRMTKAGGLEEYGFNQGHLRDDGI